MTDTAHIEECAVFLREELGLHPTAPLPDLKEVIHQAGYRFAEEHLGDTCSGFCRYLGGEHYLIGFNKDHYFNKEFFRFTLAHELGHVSLPHHRDMLKQAELHRSDHNERDYIEREANHFAISLLCPFGAYEAFLENRNPDLNTAVKAAEYFQTSLEASARRMVFCTKKTVGLFYVTRNNQIMPDTFSDAFHKIYDSSAEEFQNLLQHLNRSPNETGTSITLSDGSQVALSGTYLDYKQQWLVLVQG